MKILMNIMFIVKICNINNKFIFNNKCNNNINKMYNNSNNNKNKLIHNNNI